MVGDYYWDIWYSNPPYRVRYIPEKEQETANHRHITKICPKCGYDVFIVWYCLLRSDKDCYYKIELKDRERKDHLHYRCERCLYEEYGPCNDSVRRNPLGRSNEVDDACMHVPGAGPCPVCDGIQNYEDYLKKKK